MVRYTNKTNFGHFATLIGQFKYQIKVSFLLPIVFSKDEFPQDYVPTVFDTHVADIEVDGKKVGNLPYTAKISQQSMTKVPIYLVCKGYTIYP